MSNTKNVRLIIKEGTFSSLFDLFVQFTHGDRAFYTLPKDGQGQIAKWEQVFVLEVDKRQTTIDLQFEGCQGGPIDRKVLAVSEKLRFSIESSKPMVHTIDMFQPGSDGSAG